MTRFALAEWSKIALSSAHAISESFYRSRSLSSRNPPFAKLLSDGLRESYDPVYAIRQRSGSSISCRMREK
jgi:hypothetical protein